MSTSTPAGREMMPVRVTAGKQNPEHRPLKILYFVDSLNVGGSESQMTEVARRLSGKGHEIAIGCLHARGQYLDLLDDRKIKVVEFPPQGNLLGPRGMLQLFRLVSFLRRSHFDVVHAHDLYSNLFAVPAAWLARVPKIISSRRDLGSWWWYTPKNRKILRWVQSLSNVVVANSWAVRNYLVSEDGFQPQQIRVVHNGVSENPWPRTPAFRSRLIPGCNQSDRIVAVVANMHVHTKGHTYLIQAARTVVSQFPNAKFALIGEGVLRGEFQQQIRNLALEHNFLFLGARKDVPELLAASDVGLLASLAEGLPNAVLEYLAAGLPVVATRVGGVPEIIEAGVNGLLVPPADPGALADAVMDLFRRPDYARQLGQAGRESVQGQFGFDRLIGDLECLYAE